MVACWEQWWLEIVGINVDRDWSLRTIIGCWVTMMVSDWLLGTYAYARAAQSCFAHWWWLNRTRFLNSRNQPLLCDCMKCRTVCSKSHKVCNNDFCSFEWISSIVRVYSFSSLFFYYLKKFDNLISDCSSLTVFTWKWAWIEKNAQFLWETFDWLNCLPPNDLIQT